MLRSRVFTALLFSAVLALASAGAIAASLKGLAAPAGHFVVHEINPVTRSVLITCTLVDLPPAEDVTLSFTDSWGPANDLSVRVKNLRVASLAGDRIEHTKSGKVKYTFTAPGDGAALVSYRLDLSGKRSREDYHNCDSIDDRKLILFGSTGLFVWNGSGYNPATIAVEAPQGWQITTRANRLRDGSHDLADVREAVFLVGAFGAERFRVDGVECIVAVDHGFLFPAAQINRWVAEIVARHKTMWGSYPLDRLMVVMGNYPFAVGGTSLGGQYIEGAIIFFGGVEEAAKESEETPMAFYKTLAHEMFHAGNPTMLRTDDRQSQIWWGEGATEYMAFKTTLANGHMTADDFLEKIAKTYADGLTSTYVRDLSLVDAAKDRFDSGKIVYGKGLLASMVLDLALRNSGGKIGSIEDLFCDIARRGRFGAEADQPTLIEYLDQAGVGDLARSLVSTKGMSEITRVLPEYGLKIEKAQMAYFGVGLEAENKIEKVYPETAAEKAGLKDGDVILAVNGRELDDFTELKDVIDSLKAGQFIQLVVERDGEELSVHMTVGKRDDSKLVPDDEAPDRVKAVLNHWLTGR